MLKRLLIVSAIGLASAGLARAAASIVVAAVNSTPQAKAKADLVCTGKADQVKLLKSFRYGLKKVDQALEANPATRLPDQCVIGHSVEWLPGDYYLSGTLTIPDGFDCAIKAEGARFHLLPKKGDAVVLEGMCRCRYAFGTIFTDTDGAALRVRPTAAMRALMSVVGFTGLIGTRQRGIGLCVDSSLENACTLKFEGTDINGFDIGIFVPDARPAQPGKAGSGKTDTNWYWCSYIRNCHTCIWEQQRGIDDEVWFVNVDADIPDSVAIRTAGAYGRWFVIMGTWGWFSGPHAKANKTRSLVLDPGAMNNVIEVTPPLSNFAPAEDNSGNDTNVVLASNRAPLAGHNIIRNK